MPHIYSTLGNDNAYTVYGASDKEGKNVPPVEKQIHIKGGAGVANKNLVTPKGVVTKVSAEDLALLRQNSSFAHHEKNEFIVVDDTAGSGDAEADDMADAMNPNDPSKPKTPDDYKDENGAQLSESSKGKDKGKNK